MSTERRSPIEVLAERYSEWRDGLTAADKRVYIGAAIVFPIVALFAWWLYGTEEGRAFGVWLQFNL